MIGPSIAMQEMARKWGRRPYPSTPYARPGGCTCGKTLVDGKHVYDIGPDSSCRYHAYAAKHPGDHRNPWNCPTYWDGCNCPDTERIVRNVIASQRHRRGARTRPDKGIRRPWNPYL